MLDAGVDGDILSLACNHGADIGERLHMERGVLHRDQPRDALQKFFKYIGHEIDIGRLGIVVDDELAAAAVDHRHVVLQNRTRTGSPVVRRHQNDAGSARLHAVTREVDRKIGARIGNVNESRNATARGRDQGARQLPALSVGQVDRFADVHRVRDHTHAALDQEIHLFCEGIEIDSVVGLERSNRRTDDTGVGWIHGRAPSGEKQSSTLSSVRGARCETSIL